MMKLKRIRLKPVVDDYTFEEHDVRRVMMALQEAGFYATFDQAKELWHRYSLTVDLSWALLPPNNSEIVQEVKWYFDTEVDDADSVSGR